MRVRSNYLPGTIAKGHCTERNKEIDFSLVQVENKPYGLDDTDQL